MEEINVGVVHGGYSIHRGDIEYFIYTGVSENGVQSFGIGTFCRELLNSEICSLYNDKALKTIDEFLPIAISVSRSRIKERTEIVAEAVKFFNSYLHTANLKEIKVYRGIQTFYYIKKRLYFVFFLHKKVYENPYLISALFLAVKHYLFPGISEISRQFSKVFSSGKFQKIMENYDRLFYGIDLFSVTKHPDGFSSFGESSGIFSLVRKYWHTFSQKKVVGRFSKLEEEN